MSRNNRVGEWSIIFFTLIFFVFLYPITKPFPYSDDWSYLGPLSENGLTLDFLLSAHNDHRIPLQKAVQYLFLKLSGGDFRPLIALNIICISVCSYLWILISRLLNTSSAVVELTVPMFALSWGFNTVAWGFSFQFVSSFLFSSIFIFQWVRNIALKHKNHWMMYVTLILLALCGANGLLLSIFLGLSFTSYLVYFCFNSFKRALNVVSMSVWFIVIFFLLYNFESSAASKIGGISISDYLAFFASLSGSWLGIYATKLYYLKIGLTLCAIFVSIYICLRKPAGDEASLKAEFPLAIFTISTIFVLIIVALSRAGSQPWWPGLELHYGFLAIGFPLCALAIANQLPIPIIKNTVVFLFILVGTISYSSNMLWRVAAAEAEYKNSLRTSASILSSSTEMDVAKEGIKDFYWVSGEAAERSIADAIPLLRQLPFWKQHR